MQIQNYNQFSNNAEFSKYFLIKRYLKFTDEELEENLKGFDQDKKFFPNLAQAGMEQEGTMNAPEEAGAEEETDTGALPGASSSDEEKF